MTLDHTSADVVSDTTFAGAGRSLLCRSLREIHAVTAGLLVLDKLEIVCRESEFAYRAALSLCLDMRRYGSPRMLLPKPFSLSIISAVSVALRSSMRGGRVRKLILMLDCREAGVSACFDRVV